jgi:hypothetical protein
MQTNREWSQRAHRGGADVNRALDHDALFHPVKTRVERIMRGDGEHAFDGLTDEAQDLALSISGRALMQFCDANAGKHEEWGWRKSRESGGLSTAGRSLLRWKTCWGHGWQPSSLGGKELGWVTRLTWTRKGTCPHGR